MKKLWNIYSDKLGLTIFHPQFIINNYKESSIKDVLTLLSKLKNQLVLDIGSGRMTYRERIENLHAKYVGLDHPTVSLLYNKKHKPELIGDVTKKIPSSNNKYDIAIMFEVLEYLDNPEKSFSEIHRVLKKYGTLFITSPFLYPIHDYPHDRNRFTGTKIKYLLEKYGFKVIKIENKGGYIKTITLLSLVSYFKNIQNLISSKNYLKKILGIFMLLPSPFLVVFQNTASSILEMFETKESKKYFPISICALAKKI